MRLSELVGSAEERPCVNRRGTTPAETAKEYWKRAVAIPFLDIVSSELKSEKRAHYELCALMPEVISKKDENAVASLLNILKEKWEHILRFLRRLKVSCFAGRIIGRGKKLCQMNPLHPL